MSSVRIARTPISGLRPVGTVSDRSHDRVITLVRTHVGADAAALFAEPVPTRDGQAIDWYADPGDAKPVPLAELGEATRGDASHRLLGLMDQVSAAASALEAKGGASAVDGATLRAAATLADPESVFLAGDRLILTGWGYQRENRPNPIGVLRTWVPAPPGYGTTAAAAAAPIAPPPAAGGGWLAWLLWLLFLLLALAILYLLLSACDLSPRGGWFNRCPAPAVAAIQPAEADALERRALLRQIAELQGQLGREAQSCRVERRAALVAPPVPEVPAPEPLVPEEEPVEEEQTETPPVDEELQQIEQDVADAGGEEGNLQVILSWEGASDLDLVLQCPTGEYIYFDKPNGCSGGRLDVDANFRRRLPRPVENITWPDAEPPSGPYRAWAYLFRRKDGQTGPIPYRLIVKRGDEVIQDERGIVRREQKADEALENRPATRFELE